MQIEDISVKAELAEVRGGIRNVDISQDHDSNLTNTMGGDDFKVGRIKGAPVFQQVNEDNDVFKIHAPITDNSSYSRTVSYKKYSKWGRRGW